MEALIAINHNNRGPPVLFNTVLDVLIAGRHVTRGHHLGIATIKVSMLLGKVLGETSKFNFCGPSFPHSLTEGNYIVCDFCRSLTELSGVSILPYIVI